MKIFVSYSRSDAGDFAQQIQRHFSNFKYYNVFTDVDSIQVGDIWSSIIENNISSCDVFVAIVTYGALHSPHVENEVLQAQREKKKVIPCFHRNVREDDIKWGLNKIQGVEFSDKFELARDLYSKIAQIGRDSDKRTGGIFGFSSKESSEVKEGSNKYKVQQPKVHTLSQYTSTYKEDSSATKGEKVQAFNLKIIIPIIAVVAVIVSLMAFASLSGSFNTKDGSPGGSDIEPVSPPPSSPSQSPSKDVNNPPVANDGSSIITDMNQPADIRLSGFDQDNDDDLTAAIVSEPLHGQLGEINQATGDVTYTPNPGFVGTDEFTFKVNDGKVDSNNVGRVSVSVVSG